MAALIVCAHCGKEAFKAASKTRRFCSNECSHAGRNPSAEERFWSRVDKRGEDECWVWTGHSLKAGYGVLGIGKKQVMTHRFSWALHNGQLPAGANVLHRCDNPPCCNPRHLWLGSLLDNNRDRAQKNRNADQRGEANDMAKLNADDVRKIWARRATGALYREIAADLNVRPATVGDVVRGTTWKHLRPTL